MKRGAVEDDSLRCHSLAATIRPQHDPLFATETPMATQTMTALSVDHAPRSVRWVEKYFYLAMSLLIATVVIYGFSHTIDRRLIHANPRPPTLLWVHVALFSSWVAFYILQSTLVRIRKVKLHRTLGWVGAALGSSMVVVGFWVAVVMARFDTSQLHRPNRDAFLLVPLADILAFAISFGLAIVWRKNPERHRRLMLIGTCVLTGAAFGRMPLMHSPLHFYGGIDGLILLGASRDLLVSRRIHTIYLIAIPLLVAAQTAVAQIFLHRAAFWIRISHALLH